MSGGWVDDLLLPREINREIVVVTCHLSSVIIFDAIRAIDREGDITKEEVPSLIHGLTMSSCQYSFRSR